ncbi:MAG: 50S ribosomal protein L22 [Phycisphaeraceae bacterium]|nr:MAG: 50S ribosomal protein L22 [Phycisphaeraceae bacterium]
MGERESLAAIRNWLQWRGHPRPKVQDINALAEALGCEPKDFARFVSISRFQRSSPRKAQLIADLIRGRSVDEAITMLSYNKRRAATQVMKTLKTAIADAELADADVGALIVAESRIDKGVIIKRFQPKDRGRAHPIQKRTSHIIVGVEEAA